MYRKKRENWGNEIHKLPTLDLVKIQLDSYSDFLNNRIGDSLRRLNPIKDFSGKTFQFEFLSHKIGDPKITPKEALEKGVSFDAPLWATAKLTNLSTNSSQEKRVFLGDIPLMTSIGTFIINGVERVVINQLVRSPGVYYTKEIDPQSGRYLHKAEIRPIHGSWIEMMISKNDHLSVRIDRRRKISVTTLLRAIGFSSNEEIINLFSNVDTDKDHPYIATTLLKDSSSNTDEALLEFYEKIRPGEPAVLENAKNLLRQMFFDDKRYNFGAVGRYKINKKLTGFHSISSSATTLTKDDIVATIRYLLSLQNGKGKTDDIDHLANRRLRQVGELVDQTSLRRGLLSLERSIREKMSLARPEELHTPASFVNPRPIVAAIAEFFRRNRLSAILDQVNPLSEIDTIRRATVMGPGGVTRERASFSMRDIHNSQYSKICPIRSPEGPNIGLVTYLALFTKVNKFGFLQAPYLKVERETVNNKLLMKIGKQVVYLTADDEEDFYITHAEVKQENGYITDKWVACRYQGEFIEADVTKVQYIDVVPHQVVGTSASLIPFVHHDDGIRALMGSHMQTQAVPLVKPESPIVGTGMEGIIANSMGWVVKARHGGAVVSSDAQHISIKISSKDAEVVKKEKLQTDYGYVQIKDDIETYEIRKFYRTSQNTCYSQNPLVVVGNKIKEGEVIINGPASDEGELALGQNLLIAYMSFEGLGYEDAIVVSSSLLEKDQLSSIHISEHVAEVMDTKLGPEELTNDIPNVSEQDLRYLGPDGIIVPGSVVGPRDILVGKIAPKGETELSAEERLLRAIFGEKAREVRDTSLRLPHGDQGVVVNIQALDRDNGDELSPGVIKQVKVRVAQLRKLTVGDKLAGRHGNKGVISKIVPKADMPYLANGRPIDIIISPLSVLARMNLGQLLEAHLGLAAEAHGIKIAVPVFEQVSEERIAKLQLDSGLPSSGKVQLYDGRTGEKFIEKTATGIAYILKLIHMVEDKTHARSTGPYSLVTQQPLGGKAQRGGQRLGEMEVWALEAHKAAHILQEMLTIKSDDVVGRSKAFEAIVKGLPIPESTLPESFKVLVKELNALGMSILPVGNTNTNSLNNTKKDTKKEEIPDHSSSNITKETMKKNINIIDDK